MTTKISRQTRIDIFDYMRMVDLPISGRMSAADFLSRIFDLTELPSSDHRFENMRGDVVQHTEYNDDWDRSWMLNDERLSLLTSDDSVFLKFVCQMIHPTVRENSEDVAQMVGAFNPLLGKHGFQLVERIKLGNRPVYDYRPLLRGVTTHLNHARERIKRADSSYVAIQVDRMEQSVESAPDLAIGTAKEFVETICSTILEDIGKTVDKNWTLAQRVKNTARELALAPENIPDSAKSADAIKRLLNNLASITDALGELRNTYGTGHGKSASAKGMQTRHARLAIGAASTLGAFLWETHEERIETARATKMPVAKK